MLISLRILEHESLVQDEGQCRHGKNQHCAAVVQVDPDKQQGFQDRNISRVHDGVRCHETKDEAIVVRFENQIARGLEIEQHSRYRGQKQSQGIVKAEEYQKSKAAVAEQGIQYADRKKSQEIVFDEPSQ
jgi:hypothetical protein